MNNKMSESEKLTQVDIVLMEEVIRVSQSRGAFRAEEMEKIGVLYNKLRKFSEQIREQMIKNQLMEEETKEKAGNKPSLPTIHEEEKKQ